MNGTGCKAHLWTAWQLDEAYVVKATSTRPAVFVNRWGRKCHHCPERQVSSR